MTNEEYEFILTDRIAKIQAINEQYDLEHNSYVAFSGGKDSVVLSYLIDLALPNNNIPRIYFNTGIEYLKMLKFVKSKALNDKRILIFNSNVNIKKMLFEYGFPFKSKQHAHNISIYQHGGLSRCVRVYLGIDKTNGGRDGLLKCPKLFEYNFTSDFKLKCSDKCCIKLKKEIAHKYEKLYNKKICITGMRKDEGGSRKFLNCISAHGTKFNPLIVINNEFEEEFIKRNNIKLCDLYYAPFNFQRTGCKGCPFAQNLQNELNAIYHFFPNEYKQCLHLWKPVYDEYIRIGYRLKYYPHESEEKQKCKDNIINHL